MPVLIELPDEVPDMLGCDPAALAGRVRELLAVDLYQAGRVSLGKAAEVAGVPMAAMGELLERHAAFLRYATEDAEADWLAIEAAATS